MIMILMMIMMMMIMNNLEMMVEGMLACKSNCLWFEIILFFFKFY